MSSLNGGMGEEVNLGKIAFEVLALIKGDLAVAVSNRGFQIHGGVFSPLRVIEPASEKAIEVFILGIHHNLGAPITLLAHADGVAQLF